MLRADPLRVGPGPDEKRVQDRIVELSFREEVMMRQHARVQWLSEGDTNTKYFQKKASARKAKNKISSLVRANGTTCSDPRELADMTSAFYENLYTSEGSIGIEEVLSQRTSPGQGEMRKAAEMAPEGNASAAENMGGTTPMETDDGGPGRIQLRRSTRLRNRASSPH